MAKNELNGSENILVKVDQNNLIYIDPNSVVTDGFVEPRGTNAENFVYYINLEADLIPRTILNTANSVEGSTLTSIANGTLNLLQNKDSDYLDTSWTNTYNYETIEAGKEIDKTNTSPISDASGQGFGMTSVAIDVKGTNFIPSVSIQFVDVRGKTLFESPENSPYKAFFHQPWPIFYLTVKGFYGKAIKYRLHLVSFNSSYDDTNGNFVINTKFVGSTYAHLNQIPLTGILNAPYMFAIEKPDKREVNESTGEVKVTLSKSSKGYQTLKSIYQEYRRKGLITIPEDINPTLKELIIKAKSLDVELEKMIFNEVADMSVFAQVKAIEDVLTEYRGAVKSWKTRFLTADFVTIPEPDGKKFFYLVKTENGSDKNIKGSTGSSLKSIIETYSKKLKKAQETSQEKIDNSSHDRKTKSEMRINLINNIKDVDSYHTMYEAKNVVAINELLEDILDINKSFLEQKLKLQNAVEKKMNEFYVDKSKGIGFEPTIRNVFGVILANADTFIRLFKSTHQQAFNVGPERAKRLVGFEGDTVKNGSIYPWPEVKKVSEGNSKVLAYPGDPDLISKLGSDDKVLWPEVNFVENYLTVSTLKEDPLVNKEKTFNTTVFTFDSNDADVKSIKPISTTNSLYTYIPYTEKNLASVLYEIYERSQLFTLYDTFSNSSLNELVRMEFDTIQEIIKEDFFIVDILRDSVKNESLLLDLMKSFSPFDRYPYYLDRIPTVDYINDLRTVSFKLESYNKETIKLERSSEYPTLSGELDNYTSEEYRTKIYPFNSDTYLGYIGKPSFTKSEIDVSNLFIIDTNQGFISSPINAKSWVKNETNIFNKKIGIGSNSVNVLNSPYFHKTLFEEFHNTNAQAKYKGSAYLLLNSLDFKDLTDKIKFGDKEILMSSLFTEVGSTHYIPYHLILKWGSIYHRYKTFIVDEVDIIDNAEDNINIQTYFDNSYGYTGSTYSLTDSVGLYPYYYSIYHQVLHDYTFFDPNDQTGGSFESVVTDKSMLIDSFRVFSDGIDGLYYHNSFVDNSRFVSSDLRYTILPSYGSMVGRFNYLEDQIDSCHFNFRSNWTEDEYEEFTLTGQTLPSYKEHFVEMSSNNKKVIDLIGVFSPPILDSFEKAFLNFASEKIDSYESYKQFENTTHDNFQSLLKEICSVKKESSDNLNNLPTVISKIKERQTQKLKDITAELLSQNNLLKLTISNPKELDTFFLSAYAGEIERQVNFGSFDATQLTTGTKYIELYIGEDIDGYYSEFFSVSNIELSDDNIFNFRSIVKIYGGYRKSGGSANRDSFQNHLLNEIIVPHQKRHGYFLQKLIPNFSSLKRDKDENNNQSIVGNYGDTPLKLQTYNTFKLFNDSWIAGNSIGQKLLMEEFLFLDKANKDIGDDFFIDIKKLIALDDYRNQGLELYGVISMILSRSNVDLRALPAYVNFYGNSSNKTKIKPSRDIANIMFGKYLEVDLEYATPKIILQYVGRTSKHLDLSTISKEYLYLNDGFNIADSQNNPLLITNPKFFESNSLSKSNKVVAFEVSFGDQNQGIFKGVSLDQSQFRNTYESNLAIERLGRSESGSGTGQIDIGLYDIYESRSYSCQVEAMGNVMIQPTMYFQLKNVPLFEGAYWIVEVSHRIEGNTIKTTFKGVRIPKDSLPDPKESFTASYRVLFDKILNAATAKNSTTTGVTTEETITTSNGTFTTDRSGTIIPGEELLKESGITNLCIPFNGYGGNKTIQKVKYKSNTWYRSLVITMDSGLNDSTVMFLPTKIKRNTVNPSKLMWSEIKNSNKYFYSAPFVVSEFKETPSTLAEIPTADYLMYNSKTHFFNPLNSKSKTIIADSKLDINNLPAGPGISRYVNGPIDVGDRVITKDGKTLSVGLTLSKNLMKDLGLNDGDVVYFKIE